MAFFFVGYHSDTLIAGSPGLDDMPNYGLQGVTNRAILGHKEVLLLAREEVIRIKVSKGVKACYQAMCEALGMAESGLGAYIIGTWLMQQETIAKPMLDRLSQAMEVEAKTMISKQLDLVRQMETGD